MQRHTLYPFYADFLPQARSRQVLEARRSGCWRHLRQIIRLPLNVVLFRYVGYGVFLKTVTFAPTAHWGLLAHVRME